MFFCASRYEILIWKYLEVYYLPLNHAVSIIHTKEKLSFVPDPLLNESSTYIQFRSERHLNLNLRRGTT